RPPRQVLPLRRATLPPRRRRSLPRLCPLRLRARYASGDQRGRSGLTEAAFCFAQTARAGSVFLQEAEAEDAALQILEQLGYLRVAQRLVRGIRHQVLLRDIGDVFGVGVLGEQMIEGLILVGPGVL